MTTTGWDLLLRFAVMFFQIHLLGVLFLRLFRPEAVTREHLFAPAASPSADPSAGSLRSTGRFLLRLLRMVLWPLAGTVLAFFLPKPKDFVASPFLFAVWLLFMFAFLVVYLWKSFGAPPLRQALPVVVLSILLRGAAETAVQHSLTLPALAGPLVVRFLGLDFQRGSVTVVSSMGGFFQQASNVLLTAILILGATAPSLLRVYPKRLRGKARFLFVAFLAVLLAPIALYTELLRDISATRPYLPAELFGLLLVILLGVAPGLLTQFL